MRVRALVVPPTGHTRYSIIDSENPDLALAKIIGSATVSALDLPGARVGIAFDETAGDRDSPDPNPRAMRIYDTLLETNWADGETLLGTWVFYGLSPNGRPRDVPPEVVRLLDDPLLITGYPGKGFAGDYTDTSIGRLPITAPRGGIKYQTHTQKGTTMHRMTKAQTERELAANTALMTTLRTRRNQLKKQLKQTIPAEPPSTMTMFTVSVRFTERGAQYQYLVLRQSGHYYTTSTKPGSARFSSWEALCDWLEGPDVYSHTDLEVLQGAGKVVSFASGEVETLPGQAAF